MIICRVGAWGVVENLLRRKSATDRESFVRDFEIPRRFALSG